VTFTSGGENVPGGDIPEIDPYNQQSRTFPVAGTYTWKDSKGGSTGEIFVRTQPTY
jgi:hypothetical protein